MIVNYIHIRRWIECIECIENIHLWQSIYLPFCHICNDNGIKHSTVHSTRTRSYHHFQVKITNDLVTFNSTPSSSIKMILINLPCQLRFGVVVVSFFVFRAVFFSISSTFSPSHTIYLLKSIKSNVYQHSGILY